MSATSRTDWTAFDAITKDEAYDNALSDPDAHPDNTGKRVELRAEDGATVLERFRKALEREKKVQITARFDADVVRYYKAKGKGYQSVMNAALRACMEAEMAQKSQ